MFIRNKVKEVISKYNTNNPFEIIDILDIFEKAYGDKPFDMSTTTKTEEIINLDELD